MAKYQYGFHEERGQADLYVSDADGKTIWEAHYPEYFEQDGEMVESSTIFEDGYMKDSADIQGLEKYLKSVSVLQADDEIVEEFEEEVEEGYGDDILEFTIPAWAVSDLINGDASGLTEEDIEKLDKFTSETVAEHGNANFMLPNEEDMDLGFRWSNDIDNLGSDCVLLLLRPTKEFKAGGTVETAIKKRLRNAFELPIQLAVYVPSTRDKDILISRKQMEHRVDEVEDFLSKNFGGFSAVKLEGGYDTKDKGLIQEEAVRVVAFAKKENDNGVPFIKSFEQLIIKIKHWCKEWSQDSIGLEFENDMFYIKETTQFRKGGLAGDAHDLTDEDLKREVLKMLHLIADTHPFQNYYLDPKDNTLVVYFEGELSIDDTTLMIEKIQRLVPVFDFAFKQKGSETKLTIQLESNIMFADGGSVEEGNLRMLDNNAHAIKHHTGELENVLEKKPRVDAWVVAKAERAETDLSDITHYLDGMESSSYKHGGMMADGGKLMKIANENKIKLADGSNTTFDASNPDIRFEDGGELTDEQYRIFEQQMQDAENEYNKFLNDENRYSFGYGYKGNTYAVAQYISPKYISIADFLIAGFNKKGYKDATYSTASTGSIYVYKNGIGSGETARISDHIGKGGIYSVKNDISTLQEAKEVLSNTISKKDEDLLYKQRKEESDKKFEEKKYYSNKLKDLGYSFGQLERTYQSPDIFRQKHKDYVDIRIIELGKVKTGKMAYKYEFLKPFDGYSFILPDDYTIWQKENGSVKVFNSDIRYEDGGEVTPALNKKVIERAMQMLKSKGDNVTEEQFNEAYDKAVIEFGHEPSHFKKVMSEIGEEHFEDDEFRKGGNVASIEKKVAEVNRLIELGNKHNLQVVDTSGTWQAPMKYKPFKYSNGVLHGEYEELDLYSHLKGKGTHWIKVKEKVKKSDMHNESPLNHVARMYRKALNQAGISYEHGGMMAKGGEVKAGDKVKIEIGEGGEYMFGTVEKINEDGTADVTWRNGRESKKFSLSQLKSVMKKGGVAGKFERGVKKIEKKLAGSKVVKKYQKLYGKTYDKAEAHIAALKIKGAQRAKELANKIKAKKK
jgi:hypothetical protein